MSKRRPPTDQTNWLDAFDAIQRRIAHAYWERMLHVEREKLSATDRRLGGKK